jgi:hypothetical protein
MNYQIITSPEYEVLTYRLELLFECLWQCSQYQEVGRGYIFTTFQRMLINQERGALMSQQTLMLYNEATPVRYYQVPESIETKIQLIKSKL